MTRFARLAWLAAAVGLASCQCLVPVSDLPDGGSRPDGGGVDGGRSDGGLPDGGAPDAGLPDGGCQRASQCSAGPRPSTSWCSSGPDAGYSCIEEACVWECPLGSAGRTCSVNQASYCLECGDAGTSCPLTNNCGSLTYATTVEPGSTCTTWPGTSTPLSSVTFQRGASAQCRFMLIQTGGTLSLGELWRLNDGEYVAYLPGFGGWCTGRSAFTGAARSIISCPDCQFALMGFE